MVPYGVGKTETEIRHQKIITRAQYCPCPLPLRYRVSYHGSAGEWPVVSAQGRPNFVLADIDDINNVHGKLKNFNSRFKEVELAKTPTRARTPKRLLDMKQNLDLPGSRSPTQLKPIKVPAPAIFVVVKPKTPASTVVAAGLGAVWHGVLGEPCRTLNNLSPIS